MDLYRERRPNSELDADALIFLGGPMSANDDFPYLQQEIAAIRRAASRGKPILGVCLGAQLIAKTLGARVYENSVNEIGWAPVSWTPAVAQDTLFRNLSNPEQLFHWHGETFDFRPEPTCSGLPISAGIRLSAWELLFTAYNFTWS